MQVLDTCYALGGTSMGGGPVHARDPLVALVEDDAREWRPESPDCVISQPAELSSALPTQQPCYRYKRKREVLQSQSPPDVFQSWPVW